jgi:hypothetical protein
MTAEIADEATGLFPMHAWIGTYYTMNRIIIEFLEKYIYSFIKITDSSDH